MTKFRTAWEKEPATQFGVGELITDDDVKNVLNEWDIKELNDLTPYCYDLKERGYLTEQDMFWQITFSGRKALDTEFSYLWQRAKAVKKLGEQREKKDQRDDEERRHKENLKEKRSQTSLTKWGIIGSILLSIAGIIIATLAYFK